MESKKNNTWDSLIIPNHSTSLEPGPTLRITYYAGLRENTKQVKNRSCAGHEPSMLHEKF